MYRRLIMGNDVAEYALVFEQDSAVVLFYDTVDGIKELIEFLSTSVGYAQNFKFWLFDNVEEYEDAVRTGATLRELQRLYSVLDADPSLSNLLEFLYEWKHSDYCTFGTVSLMEVLHARDVDTTNRKDRMEPDK